MHAAFCSGGLSGSLLFANAALTLHYIEWLTVDGGGFFGVTQVRKPVPPRTRRCLHNLTHTHTGSSCAALPREGAYERGTELTHLGVTEGQANKVRVHTIIAGRLGHIPAPQSAHDTMQQGCCECLTLRHQAPPASYSSQPTVDSVAGRSPSRHRTTLSCLLTKTNTPQARSHCTHTELYRNAGAKRAAVAHTCPHTHAHTRYGTGLW